MSGDVVDESARAQAEAALDGDAMIDEDPLSHVRLEQYRSSLAQIEELKALFAAKFRVRAATIVTRKDPKRSVCARGGSSGDSF